LTDRGSVVGVRADAQGSTRIKAKKVILACGGFGSNRAMLQRYIPDMAEVEHLGSQTSTGDGISWGIELGAATDHMSGFLANGLICAGYGTRLSPETPRLGGVILNVHGKRFCNEDISYSEIAVEILKQPRQIAALIFDQTIYDVLSPNVHFKATIEAGALRRGHSLDELAQKLKMPVEELIQSVAERGNSRMSTLLGRESSGTQLSSPFYGTFIAPALLETQGGLKVNVHAEVIRSDGTAIQNLYAGGSVTAGISGNGGTGYLSGNGLLVALCLGMIAGENAAASLKKSLH